MARNDNRTRASDVFGKPGKTFPNGSFDYPVIVEQFSAQQEYNAKPFLTPHDTNPEIVLTSQTLSPGDNSDKNVAERYEILPGPWIEANQYDPSLGPLLIKRRAVEALSQVSSLTQTTKTTYEAREESIIVATETVQINSDGTGSTGNPAYPILSENVYDRERGAIDKTTQVTTDITSDGSLSASLGMVTEISYAPINAFLRRKIIEKWAYPSPSLTSKEIDDDGGTINIVKTIDIASAITEGESVSAIIVDPATPAIWTVVKSDPYSGNATGPLRVKTVSSQTLPGNVVTKYDTDDETRDSVTITTQQVAKPVTAPTQTPGTQVTYVPKRGSSLVGTLITATIGTTPTTNTQTQSAAYRSPALVTAVSATGTEAKDGTTRVKVNWQRRSARSRIVPHTTVLSYGTYASLASTLAGLTIFDPVLQDLIYDGIFLQANEQGVLNDSMSVAYTTGTSNAKWPFITETMAFAASSPTATEYLALIAANTLKVISANLKPWKYNLWRLEQVKVQLR